MQDVCAQAAQGGGAVSDDEMLDMMRWLFSPFDPCKAVSGELVEAPVVSTLPESVRVPVRFARVTAAQEWAQSQAGREQGRRNAEARWGKRRQA